MLIFCEMAFKYLDYNAYSHRHISPTEIGRNLGISERTVRSRVRKMEGEGFIKYYQAVPNVNLFGIKGYAMYAFQALDIPAKHQALEYFRRADWVAQIIDPLGPEFWVTFASPSDGEAQRTIEGIARNLKGSFKVFEHEIGPPTSQLGKLDWQIIQRLRYNALSSAQDLAKALSITPRMVEYRISKLLASGAFFIKAWLDVQKQQGIIFYQLTVTVDPSKQDHILKGLREMHGEKLWQLSVPMTGMIMANLFAFSSGEPENQLMKVVKLEGVMDCALSILREQMECRNPSWIDRLIGAKVSPSQIIPA